LAQGFLKPQKKGGRILPSAMVEVDLDLDINITGLVSRPSQAPAGSEKHQVSGASGALSKRRRTSQVEEFSDGSAKRSEKRTHAAVKPTTKATKRRPKRTERAIERAKVREADAANASSTKEADTASAPKGRAERAAQRAGAKSAGASSRAEDDVSTDLRPMKKARKERQDASSGVACGRVFGDLPLHNTLQRQLEFLNFNRCTRIQELAIPAALGMSKTGGLRDVQLRAPTGSGKTLAFLLPVLHQIIELGCKRSDGTICVILSPTKELTLQTLKVAESLTRMSPSLVCGSVAGGEKPKSEKARLRKGASVLCATPGRLMYHLEHSNSFVTDKVRCLVLDEADRLLDMGFEKQVRQIHRKLTKGEAFGDFEPGGAPKQSANPVQTLLVSATLTPDVRRLADFCLRKDAFWADAHTQTSSPSGRVPGADAPETVFEVPATLTQWYCSVPLKERLPALISALLSRAGSSTDHDDQQGKKAIVFFSSCASVDFYNDLFVDASWPAAPSASRVISTREAKRQKTAARDSVRTKGKKGASSDEEEDEGDDAEAVLAQRAAKVFTKTPLFKLHGNLTKEERTGFMADFQRTKGGALLASDAAARGLDFPAIDWVIQYDPPQTIEEYLHRIGRTARIGRAGNSLIFLAPHELGFLDVLKAKGCKSIRELDIQRLHSDMLRHGAPAELATARDLPSLLAAGLRRRVEQQGELLLLARTAFLSAMRSYRAFPKELRPYFPYEQVHTGHFAASFALNETPGEAGRKGGGKGGKSGAKGSKGDRGAGKGDKGAGKGAKGSGKAGKGGKTSSQPSRMAEKPMNMPIRQLAADEFAC